MMGGKDYKHCKCVSMAFRGNGLRERAIDGSHMAMRSPLQPGTGLPLAEF